MDSSATQCSQRRWPFLAKVSDVEAESLTTQQQRHDEVGGDLDAAEVVWVGASLQAADHL